MAKEKNAPATHLLQGLFQFGLYKRSQGRMARQITFGVIATVVVIGAWRMSVSATPEPLYEYGFPGLVVAAGLFVGFRAVHLPRFADFLIGVEAEMNKVSWPSRPELFRASVVVLFTIFFMAGALFVFDIVWEWIFTNLGVGG